MTQQHNFSPPPPTHIHTVIHTNTYTGHVQPKSQGVLDKFEKSMVQQSVTASKEHYLSNAKPCDGKTSGL